MDKWTTKLTIDYYDQDAINKVTDEDGRVMIPKNSSYHLRGYLDYGVKYTGDKCEIVKTKKKFNMSFSLIDIIYIPVMIALVVMGFSRSHHLSERNIILEKMHNSLEEINSQRDVTDIKSDSLNTKVN